MAEPIIIRDAIAAREAKEPLRGDEGFHRFTALIELDGQIEEEVDVDARNEALAWQMAQRIVETDMVPGCRVASLEERFGFYL